MADLPDDLAGRRIVYRHGLETRTTRVTFDRGKTLDCSDHPEQGKTRPVKRRLVERVLPDPQPTTASTLHRNPDYSRPDQTVPYRTAAAKRSKATHPTYLDHVRAHPCAVAYLGDCEGGVVAHHMPPKGMGGGGSDFATVALCDGHHREWHARYRLGPMTRDETSAHLHRWQVEVLSRWMEDRAA